MIILEENFICIWTLHLFIMSLQLKFLCLN